MRHPWEHLNLFSEFWLAILVVQLGVLIKMRPASEDQPSAPPGP
jgi:hypothetical protein